MTLKFDIIVAVSILQSTVMRPCNFVFLWRYQYYNLQGCGPEILYYCGGISITIYSDVALKFDIFLAVSILKCTGMWRRVIYKLSSTFKMSFLHWIFWHQPSPILLSLSAPSQAVRAKRIAVFEPKVSSFLSVHFLLYSERNILYLLSDRMKYVAVLSYTLLTVSHGLWNFYCKSSSV